jgi:hypothetical protein
MIADVDVSELRLLAESDLALKSKVAEVILVLASHAAFEAQPALLAVKTLAKTVTPQVAELVVNIVEAIETKKIKRILVILNYLVSNYSIQLPVSN